MTSGSIERVDETRCDYHNSNRNGPLFLLAQFYAEKVLPKCPASPPSNCTCLITHLQEGNNVPNKDRIYTVEVDCRERGLDYFPVLPEHTRSVDLARNKVSQSVSRRKSCTR